jgi:autotransporter-associated beta strand protein
MVFGSTDSTQTVEFANPVDLAGGTRTIAVTRNSYAYSTDLANLTGAISNGALTKIGPGTLVLSGNNTYAGSTLIKSGTLRAGSAGAVAGSSDLTIADDGSNPSRIATFDISSANPTVASVTLMNGSIIGAAGVLSAGAYDVRKGTISGNLGGSGDVIKTTADTVTLSGANSYTGPTVVLEGTLAVSGATLGTADAGTTVAAGAVIQVSGTVSNEPLTLYGNGISGTGAMRSGSQTGTWTGPVTLGADTVMGSDLWNTLAISGSIGDNGAGRSLTKVGTGWLTLTGTNTYGGATIVAGGMLQASDGVGLSAASNLVLAGGMYGCDTASPFTRSLGTQPGQVQWTGSGGFAAWNGKMTVNLGGNMTPDTLTWGANGFVPDGSELRLSASSNYDTEIQNPIDLGGAARTIRVGLSDGGGGGLATLSVPSPMAA